MTQQPDDRQPEEPHGSSGLDEDAAWRLIVENYGERPAMFDTDSDEADPDGTAGRDESAAPEITDAPDGPAEAGAADRSDRPDRPKRPSGNVFDRSYLDSMHRRAAPELNTEASWDDEGHFVPPPPPPLPVLDPRRKAAWIGLFGGPALLLVAVVLGWALPQWLVGGLVLGFVGGFVYLVATMPRSGGDGWSGGDGAVV
jgi:hypothetical protein